MRMRGIRPFVEWEKMAGAAMVGDPLWSVRAFRLGLYAIECRSVDLRGASNQAQPHDGDQLTRAIGSIAANIAEGYSRASSAERARFYGYALGSAREAIVWYEVKRAEIGSATDDRQETLVQIRRLLLATIRRMRPAGDTSKLRDPQA
jgi:four helix bundle protein